MPAGPSASYCFGRFVLEPAERRLRADGAPVMLGARAFDLLVVLVDNAGRLVSKNDLIARVWPGLVVEENNLQVQVSALRKLLGPSALATIPGRGYRFELAVESTQGASDALPPVPPVPDTAPPAVVPGNLPSRLPSLYGRDTAVASVEALVRRHPVVTIAGAGGMGKTRLAQAVALGMREEAANLFPQGIWWVELAAVAEGALVPGTVARAFAIQLGSGPPLVALAASLASQRLLLVLDNCEHVVAAVAELVETLRAAAPGVCVLVTSQEALKLPEEHVYRLAALDVPASVAEMAAGDGGAVQLFVARAEAVDPRFAVTTDNRTAVLEVCRRLDGIPLAIELAAARLPLLGIEGLRKRLDERFNLLTAGSRVVLRRHQTLRATLEWSHALLSPEQQTVFRRLGVFAGTFTLGAAQEVVEDEAIDRWSALDHLGALVDKSLVQVEGEGEPRYRLLETTRAYALERLADAGETRTIMRRHAQGMLHLLESFTAADDHAMPPAHVLTEAGLEIDNLRAALATAADHDDRLAVALMAHSWRVWTGAWQLGEGFEQGLALRACLRDDMEADTLGRFWLNVATLGLYSHRREAYEAARHAVQRFRASGNPALLFDALIKASVMGVRFSTLEEMVEAMTEAERLMPEKPTTSQRVRLQFVRFRVFSRLQRFEDALAAAQLQASIAREGGNLLGANYAMSNVVAAENELGRIDDARAHAEAAIAELVALGGGAGAGHCWLGLAHAHAFAGHVSEARAAARTAYTLLLPENDQNRVLWVLTLCAALDGRAEDALRTAGYRDAADARAGVLRETYWTAGQAQLDNALATGPIGPARERLMAEGASMSEQEIVRRALGDDVRAGGPAKAAR